MEKTAFVSYCKAKGYFKIAGRLSRHKHSPKPLRVSIPRV